VKEPRLLCDLKYNTLVFYSTFQKGLCQEGLRVVRKLRHALGVGAGGVARIFEGRVPNFLFLKNHCNISFVLNFYTFLDIKIDFAKYSSTFFCKKLVFEF